MILTRRNGFSLAVLAILLQSCRVLKPASFPEKLVIPTFDGYSIVRMPEKKMELTFCGDYTFFKADKAGEKGFKRDFTNRPGKKDTLILWGKTIMPAYYHFYLFESADPAPNPPALPPKVILPDSFYVNGVKVYEYAADNNHSDFTTTYLFKTGKSYRLIFKGNYQSSFTGDKEDSLLSNNEKKSRFLTETRFIMKSLKMEIPDWDINFSEINETIDSAANVYVEFQRRINTLEKYTHKELTMPERNVLNQFLATYCTFTGNYRKAFYYDSLINNQSPKKQADQGALSPADAKTAILQQAALHNILFFNEAHVDVRTRAFLISLLPELKKLGFDKLAMEGLFTAVDKEYPDINTGFYTKEPVFGMLVRKAIAYGFKLIPYEDTTGGSNSFNKRDSMQASNLLNAITANNNNTGTIVLAGYSHIYKKMDNPSMTSMVQYFSRKGNIMPFCIDAVNANKSNWPTMSYPVPFLLLKNNTPVNDAPGKYDMEVHYPGSYYKAENFFSQYPFPSRKINLANYGFAFPSSKKFMVLIYLQNEYEKTKNINKLIPVYVEGCDEGAGGKDIYLEPGRYEVCLFDELGKLITQKNILIN